MKHSKIEALSSICILTLFSFMLMMPTQVFQGAKSGLLLWFLTILPTLLPFSFISNLMIETNTIHYVSNAFGFILKPFFHVSSAGVFAIVIGFFCGYPLGAKVIGQLYQNEQISREEATYLLSFCNNVSPIFLINYIVISTFHTPQITLPVLGIILGSPIFCSFLFRKRNQLLFSKESLQNQATSFRFIMFQKCLMDSFETMVYLGGYIIAFSVLFTLIDSCTFFHKFAIFLPFLEITNGILYIQTLNLSFRCRLLYTLTITSFGGICALFQTQMVLAKTDLSISNYALKKLVTMMVTSLITILYLLFV